MDTVRIMLVDDHKMIREGIKTYLAEDESYKIVGEAENGIDCLEQLESLEVDLVLSDLNMPEMDGLELAKELKSKFPDIKLIALTMMGESQHIKQMLAEGAMGYLLKNCGESEVKLAIQNVMMGGTYYSPEVTNIIMNNIRKVKTKSSSNVAMEMPLTDREKEVLRLILKEYSNQEIADELFISVRTVDAHKRNLLDKTGSKNVAGLVIYAVDRQLFADI
ncbi:response regulator transcription factor [uncultured Roseivirga sp.]|uniref:response regulator n=1 Tax=uncultured Roseivirga sp. TaxID=543088 RepID=UPI000D7B3BEA|nr:response regulator transcription factor [uncultured Roseivirga sp.]PWL30104.1 MAG: DNA-binding response regulator [Roseivirga sp. XM-24bin3]